MHLSSFFVKTNCLNSQNELNSFFSHATKLYPGDVTRNMFLKNNFDVF